MRPSLWMARVRPPSGLDSRLILVQKYGSPYHHLRHCRALVGSARERIWSRFGFLESMRDNLMSRIRDGRTDLVFDLIAAGSPASARDDKGVSLLQWCVYYGDVSAIRFLLSNGETLDSLGENFDLNGAAFHGHWRLTQFLIEEGADANHPLPDTGETPLHSALCKAQRPVYDYVVSILLSAGADPDATTVPGMPTGSFMRDSRTRGETPLHRAAAFGTLRAIEMLLDRGANREARDVNGDTPLTWASWHLRPPSVLDKLCYGEHRIHPDAISRDSNDRGQGWGGMEAHLAGRPHA